MLSTVIKTDSALHKNLLFIVDPLSVLIHGCKTETSNFKLGHEIGGFAGSCSQSPSCTSVWTPAAQRASRRLTGHSSATTGRGFWTVLQPSQTRSASAAIAGTQGRCHMCPKVQSSYGFNISSNPLCQDGAWNV